MEVISIVVGGLVLVFGVVVWFGAPYLPTLKKQTEQALDLLDLKPGQTLLELGCGDGRVVRAAARRGWRVVGYELNPLLAVVAWVSTWRYRRQVKIIWGNYWRHGWPAVDGIFVFLLDKYMNKLNKKIVQEQSGHDVKLVSYAFQMPNRKPDRINGALFLYEFSPSIKPPSGKR